MFWTKKENKGLGSMIFLPPPPPRKKEFKTMFEILNDAEKYDNSGAKDVSDSLLTTLCDFVEKYKEKK